MSSDEWEYEYSAHETEDFYLTLDLTTHDPNALEERKPPSAFGSAAKKPTPKPTLPAENGEENAEDSDDSSSEEEEEETTNLQILDLHTPNPLIKYDQKIYSCYWTTDLGTQFHVSQSGQFSDPLRKGTVLDVLGITRARLLGKPITLVDRNVPPLPLPPIAQAPSPEDLDFQEDPQQINPGPLQIPRAQLKTAKSRSQASFLERFSALKQRKGEVDQVPIIAVKQYTAPSNSGEIKRKAEDDDRNSALVRVDGRKRRRRRAMGLRGGPGRHGREALRRRLGIEEGGMFGGEDSSPRDRVGRLEDPVDGRGVRDDGVGEEGYLVRMSREEYNESVRREEGEMEEVQPTRPPWMPEVVLEDSTQGPTG